MIAKFSEIQIDYNENEFDDKFIIEEKWNIFQEFLNVDQIEIEIDDSKVQQDEQIQSQIIDCLKENASNKPPLYSRIQAALRRSVELRSIAKEYMNENSKTPNFQRFGSLSLIK